MNKKIKAIELASRVYQRKDIPKKVKYNSTEYKYSEEFCDYENQLGNYLFSIITLRAYWMNEEVEILEDEEEIKEIQVDENGYIETDRATNLKGRVLDITFVNKINEISRKVNELDKRIKKED